MLGLLNRRLGLRVTEVARAMNLSAPATSQYLRALESCGFLDSRRIRRSIVYQLARSTADSANPGLLKALIIRLTDKAALESLFKLATAFANPGRIEVFRSLNARPQSLAELKSSTDWSRRTLWRHVNKLANRGFIRSTPSGETYVVATPADEFGRALALAAKI